MVEKDNKYFKDKGLQVNDSLPIGSVKLYGEVLGTSTQRKAGYLEIERKYFVNLTISLVQEQEDHPESTGGSSNPVEINLSIDKKVYDEINSGMKDRKDRVVMMGDLELHCARRKPL